jgi:hypothetical protein
VALAAGDSGAEVSASGLLEWLVSLPPAARDQALEERLALGDGANYRAPLDEHLLGYYPSGVAAIVRALAEVPVVAEDVFIDLGSGLGKVAILAALLTGARARGIELQTPLVVAAQRSASRLRLDVTFTHGDVRDANLDDGSVFFLYAPVVGPALFAVLDRLRSVAEQRAIVVCALGVDLRAPWLVNRDIDAFWLSIYDSRFPNARPRTRRASPLPPLAQTIALER